MSLSQVLLAITWLCCLTFGTVCEFPEVRLQFYLLIDNTFPYEDDFPNIASEMTDLMRELVGIFDPECYTDRVRLAPNNQEEMTRELKKLKLGICVADSNLEAPEAAFDGILQASHDQPWTSDVSAQTETQSSRYPYMSSFPAAAPGVDCTTTKYPSNVMIADQVILKDLTMVYLLDESEQKPVAWWTDYTTRYGLTDRTVIIVNTVDSSGLAQFLHDAIEATVCTTVEQLPTTTTTAATTTPTPIGTTAAPASTTSRPTTEYKPVYFSRYSSPYNINRSFLSRYLDS